MTDADVMRACDAGRILRTHVLRSRTDDGIEVWPLTFLLEAVASDTWWP